MAPWKFIALVLVVSAVHHGTMGYLGYGPAENADRLMQLALLYGYAWWVHEDAPRRKFHRPYELGALAFLFAPITVPVYLIATRGWKGAGIATGLVGLSFLPWGLGWAAYFIGPEGG